jgi:hypothetical protein
MFTQHSPTQKGGFAPAITLMLMAPLLTEVLPGATRFSSIFVLPIEMCVWGIGALFIRDALRRWKLGWTSMILMGIALAIAEECLIQQTSLASLVIRLKGQTYARAFGINYVYFLWALIYEPVFVVVLSISVVELIYPSRKQIPWISKSGLFVLLPLLLIGSLLAWFSWTQIARVKIFHLPPYHLPLPAVLLSITAIGVLVYAAFKMKQRSGKPLMPPSAWLLGLLGGIWAVCLYGVVLLAFGIDPAFPEWFAVAGTLVFLVIIPIAILPKIVAHPGYEIKHQFGLTCGTIIGSMAAGQLGFIGATGPDLYFKIITNVLAVFLLIVLGIHLQKQ